MGRGATKNYRFGQKNNWRRTVWNAVIQRTDGREKTQPILYLAGPQDADRPIARAKGVPNQNLIAIDLEIDNVAAVRSGSAPAVHARIEDVLRNWPASRPVAAVLLDYCCGLTMDTLDVFDIFQRAPLRKAVVAINMMRGRDAWSNDLRAGLAQGGGLPLAFICGVEALEHEGRHRAMQFLAWHLLDLWRAAVEWHGGDWRQAYASAVGCDPSGLPSLGEGAEDDEFDIVAMTMASRFYRAMRPQCFSYKSGVLTFDSAVFQSPWGKYPHERTSEQEDEIESNLIAANAGVARQLAAVMAVRTRRIEGRA